jgi:brefeldin A-resistance guanine nucleotide exchange factor 1
MSSGGYLKQPSDIGEQSEQQKRLWNDTSNRLHKFLPDLMPELFPESEAKGGQVTETETEGASNRVEASAPVPIAEGKEPETA